MPLIIQHFEIRNKLRQGQRSVFVSRQIKSDDKINRIFRIRIIRRLFFYFQHFMISSQYSFAVFMFSFCDGINDFYGKIGVIFFKFPVSFFKYQYARRFFTGFFFEQREIHTYFHMIDIIVQRVLKRGFIVSFINVGVGVDKRRQPVINVAQPKPWIIRSMQPPQRQQFFFGQSFAFRPIKRHKPVRDLRRIKYLQFSLFSAFFPINVSILCSGSQIV